LYQHYKAIAEAVDIDQILYNVPGRTAVDLLPETAIRLSTINNKNVLSFITMKKKLIKHYKHLFTFGFSLLLLSIVLLLLRYYIIFISFVCIKV
jgi:hypothetical protein